MLVSVKKGLIPLSEHRNIVKDLREKWDEEI